MRQSIQEVARTASALSDLDTFWELVHRQLEVRGVTSVLFGVLASTKELQHMRLSQALIWKSTHKKEFFEIFNPEHLLDNDVTADHCMSHNQLLFWQDPRNWENATPAEKRRASIERDLGLAIGFSVPASYYFPTQVGGIGVALPEIPLKEFDRYWQREGRELVTLCGILDAGMRGQHLSELVSLSKREAECLTWLAVGLRPDRIAEKLGVGDKSIEKYIAGARRKLRATTRDHAVAKALMLGLIEP